MPFVPLPAHRPKQPFKPFSADLPLVKLEARSAGTWGNEILIKISAADQPALVQETFPGNPIPTRLNRSNVVQDSNLNSLILKQKITGSSKVYEIIYTGTVDNNKPQVLINSTTGELTFTTLASHQPLAGDTLVARYEVPKDKSAKVELFYKATKEAYTVADASHLAEQVNGRSVLVSADVCCRRGFFNMLPLNTVVTAGSNGANATWEDYQASLDKLKNELINIVVLAGQAASDSNIAGVLMGHLNTTTDTRANV